MSRANEGLDQGEKIKGKRKNISPMRGSKTPTEFLLKNRSKICQNRHTTKWHPAGGKILGTAASMIIEDPYHWLRARL